MKLHVNACHVPEPAPDRMVEIYRRMRDVMVKQHCDAKRDHLCCGAITITRDDVTLNCPLCGDCRQLLEPEPTGSREIPDRRTP